MARDNWYGHPQPLFLPDGDGIRLYRPYTRPLNCFDVLAPSRLFNVLWGIDEGYDHKDRVSALLDFVCNARLLSDAERAHVLREVLDEMVRQIHSDGGQAIFLLLPDQNDFWSREEGGVGEDQRELTAALERSGHPWIDGLRVLRASGVDPNSLYLPNDSAHLSTLGGQFIAAALAEELIGREAASESRVP